MKPPVENDVDPDTEPPANQSLRLIALVLLVIPIVALLWVSSYSKEEPSIGGWPFFFWYHHVVPAGRRPLHRVHLVGMAYGTYTAWSVVNPATGNHFGGSLAPTPVFGQLGFIGLTAFTPNLITAVTLTVVLRALSVPNGRDETRKGDYFADEGDPRVEKRLITEPHVVTAPA